jgi:hypothetical protein
LSYPAFSTAIKAAGIQETETAFSRTSAMAGMHYRAERKIGLDMVSLSFEMTGDVSGLNLAEEET